MFNSSCFPIAEKDEGINRSETRKLLGNNFWNL